MSTRDLHNHLIHQLFGAGLVLISIDHDIGGEPAKRVRAVVQRIDRMMMELRLAQGHLDRTPRQAMPSSTALFDLDESGVAPADTKFDEQLGNLTGYGFFR